MSVYAGPNFVQSGLVLQLDAGNYRSYPGFGSTWFDLSGNNNNGTITNPTFNTGPDKGLICNGSNSISIAHSSSLDIDTLISISCWVKFNISLTSMGNHITLVSKEDYAGGTGYRLSFRTDISGDPLSWRLNGFNTLAACDWGPGIFFDDLKWHNIIATYNKSNMTIWVDNIVRRSSSYTPNISSNTNSVIIGNVLNGIINDIRIYNRILSRQEILDNFNATRGRFGV